MGAEAHLPTRLPFSEGRSDVLCDLAPKGGCQSDLFERQDATSGKPERLMTMLDAVNRKMARQSLVLAAQGFRQPWKMKQGNRTPRYTTCWEKVVMEG